MRGARFAIACVLAALSITPARASFTDFIHEIFGSHAAPPSTPVPAPLAQPTPFLAAPTVGVIAFAGANRSAELHVSPACWPAAKCPLMLVFHGNDGTGLGMERIANMDAVADAGGFVVAYPNSVGASWVLTGANDDPDFIAALAANLGALGLIDTAQVFAAGYSQGGGLVSQLISCHPGVLKGAAIVSEDSHGSQFSACGNPAPIRLIEFHGTADPISPYAGGAGKMSAPATAQLFATMFGLPGPAGPFPGPTPDASFQTWGTAPASIALYTLHGGGHTWPGGNQPSGGQLGAVSPLPASQIIWHGLSGK